MSKARTALLGAAVALPLTVGPIFAPQAVTKHYSKLKSAIVGAAARHGIEGHAKAGADAGAMIQHHRDHAGKSKAP